MSHSAFATRFASTGDPDAFAGLVGVAIGLAGASKPEPLVAPSPHQADESRLLLGFAGRVRLLKPDGSEPSRLSGDDAVNAGADMPTRAAAVSLKAAATKARTLSLTLFDWR